MQTQRKKKRDEMVDTVRVRNWFWMIQQATGVTEPRKVERLFRPDVAPRNNRFLEFSTGLRSPDISTTKRGEDLAPGSRRELEHVLWMVLRYEHPDTEVVKGWQSISDKQLSTWSGKITPELMPFVIDPDHKLITTINKHYLRKLELRAGYDSLAVLVILFRIHHGQEENVHAWDIAHSIFRMLVVLGDELDYRNIADQIWTIFESRVFSRVRFKNVTIDLALAKREFEVGAVMLAVRADIEQNLAPISKQKKLEHYSARILRNELCKDLNGLVRVPCCVVFRTESPTKFISEDSPMIVAAKKFMHIQQILKNGIMS